MHTDDHVRPSPKVIDWVITVLTPSFTSRQESLTMFLIWDTMPAFLSCTSRPNAPGQGNVRFTIIQTAAVRNLLSLHWNNISGSLYILPSHVEDSPLSSLPLSPCTLGQPLIALAPDWVDLPGLSTVTDCCWLCTKNPCLCLAILRGHSPTVSRLSTMITSSIQIRAISPSMLLSANITSTRYSWAISRMSTITPYTRDGLASPVW